MKYIIKSMLYYVKNHNSINPNHHLLIIKNHYDEIIRYKIKRTIQNLGIKDSYFYNTNRYDAYEIVIITCDSGY